MAAAAAASTVAVCARGPLRGYSIAFNFNLMPKEDRPAICSIYIYSTMPQCVLKSKKSSI